MATPGDIAFAFAVSQCEQVLYFLRRGVFSRIDRRVGTYVTIGDGSGRVEQLLGEDLSRLGALVLLLRQNRLSLLLLNQFKINTSKFIYNVF